MRARTVVRTILCIGLAAVASQVSAQAVYRCVEKGKPVSFQTEPCPTPAKVTGIKAFTPDRELTWREKQARDAQWRRRPQQQSSSAAHIRTQQASYVPSQCEAAKAERDRWERQTGLSRSYESVSSWNNYVANACR